MGFILGESREKEKGLVWKVKKGTLKIDVVEWSGAGEGIS